MALSQRKAVLMVFLGKILRAPLWVLISGLLTRILGPEGMGEWSMIMAASVLLNQLCIYWTQLITQRFGRGEWVEFGFLNGTYSHRIPLILVGLFTALLLVIFNPLGWLSYFFGISSASHGAVIVALLSLLFLSETQTVQQTVERYLNMAWTPVFLEVIFLGCLGIIYLISSKDFILVHELSISIFELFSLLAFLWAIALGLEIFSLRLKVRRKLVDLSKLKSMFFFAVPLIPTALVGYLAEWVDYFLLRNLLGTETVGYFHPAYQYVLVIIGIPSALVAVMLPKLIDTLADPDSNAIKNIVEYQLAKFIFAWGILTLPLIAILPKLLTWILDARFESSSYMLQIMLFTIPGAIVQHICMVLCLVQGRLAFSTFGIYLIKVIINFAVSFYLINKIGQNGAAIGMTVGYFALQWILLFDQLMKYEQKLICLTSLSLFLCQIFSLILVFIDGVFNRFLVALASILVLFFITKLTKVFSSNDLKVYFPGIIKKN